jgi:putative sigma-54 modulation protein
MNLTISGHQLDLTEALKNYAETKVQRLVEPFEKVIDVHLVFSTDKLHQSAEATVNLSGKTVFAKADAKDCYAAMDLLVDKLDRQLVRHKERKSNHRSSPVVDGLNLG